MYTFLLLAVAAVFPAVAITSWVARRDRLPEPRKVVVTTAVLGGLAAIPILIVEVLLVLVLGLPDDPSALETIGQAVLMAFVVASLTEESFKFLVIRGYAARHDEFDEPFDGIVYGVAASLGFALVENVLYVLGGWMDSGVRGGIVIAIMRALTAVPMHAACGIIMGTCIGIGRFKPGRGWMVLGFAAAFGFHGAYDAFLMAIPALGSPELILFSVGGFLMTFILGVVVAGLAIARMRRDQTQRMAVATIRAGLPPVPPMIQTIAEESAHGLVGHPTPPAPPMPPSVSAHRMPDRSEAGVEVPEGVPHLPMASLIATGVAAAVFVVFVAVLLIAVGTQDEPSDAWATAIGLAFLAALLLSLIAVPLSIVALVREPRWRPASVLALVGGSGELLLLGGLLILGLLSGA